jgi:hypothetical protein
MYWTTILKVINVYTVPIYKNGDKKISNWYKEHVNQSSTPKVNSICTQN